MRVTKFSHEAASIIIDAKDYYFEVWSKIQQAKERIYICGWDIHSQTCLIREDETSGSKKLADVIFDSLNLNPNLKVYMLIWDFASLYTIERELFTDTKFKWELHDRFFFQFDDQYPVSASHHQKFFVVDEALAYSGGIDLTVCRWDTSEHDPDNPYRIDADGNSYGPFHDIQGKVTGGPAKEISKTFRDRWNRLNCETLLPLKNSKEKWKDDFQFSDLDIEVSYTYPVYKDTLECTDIKELYKAQILAAKDYIYIETQYLTSREIAKALADSLQEKHGPAILILLPKRAGGWTEEVFMGSQQANRLKLLQQADHYKRLSIVYPDKKGLKDDYIVIHSKFMIVDGNLMRIGSANLSNRSMGLDSECDLSFTSKNSQEFLPTMFRLLSEHSGLKENEIKALFEKYKSKTSFFRAVILKGENLHHFEPETTTVPLDIVKLGDLRRPGYFDRFIDSNVRPNVKHSMIDFAARWWKSTIAILIIAIAIYALSNEAVQTYIQLEIIKEKFLLLKNNLYTIPLSIILLTLLLIVFFPLNILIVIAASLFSAMQAIGIIITSVLLSSVISFCIGFFLGDALYKKVEIKSLNKLKQRLKGEGIFPIFLLRTIPIAPYALINMVSGALKYNFQNFSIGTVLGILPGTILLVIFQKSLLEVFSEPSVENFCYLLIPILIFVWLFLFSKKRLSRK